MQIMMRTDLSLLPYKLHAEPSIAPVVWVGCGAIYPVPAHRRGCVEGECNRWVFDMRLHFCRPIRKY